MASKDMELLWKDFFRDPSQFSDDRAKKTIPTSPDFRHKLTSKPLWVDGTHNPPWVQVELHGSSSTCNQDRVSLLALIASCGKEKDIRKANKMYADVVRNGFLQKDFYVATALITAYAKCGAPEKSQEIFEQLPVRPVASWNALIAGYTQHGRGTEALKCFRQMKSEGISPDAITYTCILKACGILRYLEIGEGIHSEIRQKGLLGKDIMLGNSLVDMYSKCSAIARAREIFDELPVRNVVTWNALITGYTQHEQVDEALKCFRQMQNEGITPNAVTYICILKVCGFIKSVELGECIDAEIRKKRLLQKDVVLGNTLVDMYAKCGAMEKAREVFEQLPVHTVVSWTALISGYAEHGLGDEALKCFMLMKDKGVQPNSVTYTCALKACAIVNAVQIGEDIASQVRKQGLLGKDVLLGTALVDMYAKCGALRKAREIFEQIHVRDDVSWNALITGYVQHGLGEEALKCFSLMKDEGVMPNALTYVCILKACIIVRSLEIGERIDNEVRNKGLIQKDIQVGTALIDMYTNFGVLEKAREVFEQLPVQNVVSWSALMSGYAQLGRVEMVLDLFREMRVRDIMPNPITFLILLAACSHAGLLEEGEQLFDDMCAIYKLTPTLEHYTCMIDLFGRAGQFDKVKSLIDKASASEHLPLYLAVLGACQKWVNVMLGRWAFERLLLLDGKSSAPYVCMENIYIAAGMQTEAEKVGQKQRMAGNIVLNVGHD